MIKKSLLAVCISAALSAPALANPITLNLLNGQSLLLGGNLNALDWAESGSGVNIGSSGALNVGDTFEFRYQAKLGSLTPQDNTTPAGAVGLVLPFASGGFEFTAVSSFIVEVISAQEPGDYVYNIIGTSGGVDLYYDDIFTGGLRANVQSGLGFDDGTLVGRMTALPFDSTDGTGRASFQVSSSAFDAGTGSAKTKFALKSPTDFLDSNFFDFGLTDLSSILMFFDSNQNIPVGTSTAQNVYGHVITASDTLLKVDGSSFFESRPVSSPSTIALLGLGLIGLARRVKNGSKQA